MVRNEEGRHPHPFQEKPCFLNGTAFHVPAGEDDWRYATPQSFADSLSNESLPNPAPEAWTVVVTRMVLMFCAVNSRVGLGRHLQDLVGDGRRAGPASLPRPMPAVTFTPSASPPAWPSRRTPIASTRQKPPGKRNEM